MNGRRDPVRSGVDDRRDLVIGIGASRDVTVEEVVALLRQVRRGENVVPQAVGAFATLRRDGGEDGVEGVLRDAATEFTGASVPLLRYGVEDLAQVSVSDPSEQVRRAVGVAGVAEAAALLAAAEWCARPTLVVGKRKGDRVTAAVSRIRPLWTG